MSEAAPINIPINKQIDNDLKKEYKAFLEKHLSGRAIKEDKINFWIDNILSDAKEYFIKKYPNYDLFLFVFVCPKNVYFYGNSYSISIIDIDWCDSTEFQNEDLYSCMYFFYYKKYNFDYQIESYENEIIQKGSDISKKYLQDRNYGKECNNYTKYINQEYCDFILTKCDTLRCYFLNHIYQNPIQGKYYFKYLSHGKNIYSKFVQTYENDSLNCCHYLFFFK